MDLRWTTNVYCYSLCDILLVDWLLFLLIYKVWRHISLIFYWYSVWVQRSGYLSHIALVFKYSCINAGHLQREMAMLTLFEL